MKVALYFGSFNPIHVGHLIVANTVVEQTDCQQVWFVVSPQNPLKSKNLLHEFDRFDMVRMAIDDNPSFGLSDIEFNMPRPSYTIHSLVRLEEKYPQHTFEVIIGEDNLQNFRKWKNHERILDYFGLIVYPRPNSQAEDTLWQHPKVRKVNAPLLDISASYIRECIQKNRSIRYLVPENVEQYIRLKNFYI